MTAAIESARGLASSKGKPKTKASLSVETAIRGVLHARSVRHLDSKLAARLREVTEAVQGDDESELSDLVIRWTIDNGSSAPALPSTVNTSELARARADLGAVVADVIARVERDGSGFCSKDPGELLIAWAFRSEGTRDAVDETLTTFAGGAL